MAGGTPWQYAPAAAITDAADDVLVAASAGQRHYLESLQFINTDATVGTEVEIKSGSTVIWRGFAPASLAALTQPGMVPVVFKRPLRGALGEALNVACVTTSSQTYVNAQGYTVAD